MAFQENMAQMEAACSAGASPFRTDSEQGLGIHLATLAQRLHHMPDHHQHGVFESRVVDNGDVENIRHIEQVLLDGQDFLKLGHIAIGPAVALALGPILEVEAKGLLVESSQEDEEHMSAIGILFQIDSTRHQRNPVQHKMGIFLDGAINDGPSPHTHRRGLREEPIDDGIFLWIIL